MEYLSRLYQANCPRHGLAQNWADGWKDALRTRHSHARWERPVDRTQLCPSRFYLDQLLN